MNLNQKLNSALEKQKELEERLDSNESQQIKLSEFDSQYQEQLTEMTQKFNESQSKLLTSNNELERIKKELNELQNNSKSGQNGHDDPQFKKLLKELTDKTEAAEKKLNDANNKINLLEIENEELSNLNKEFISSSEGFLITFKKENEATLNFAQECRKLLAGEDDETKLDSANLDRHLAEGVRQMVYSVGDYEDDDEILKMIKNLVKKS